MNAHQIGQIVIMVCSAVSIWLQGCTGFKWKRLAFAVSLIAQPFWFWTAYTHGQWGIVCLAFWFTFCNVRGFWRHRKPRPSDNVRPSPRCPVCGQVITYHPFYNCECSKLLQAQVELQKGFNRG